MAEIFTIPHATSLPDIPKQRSQHQPTWSQSASTGFRITEEPYAIRRRTLVGVQVDQRARSFVLMALTAR